MFVFGLLVGSFLNVIALRYKEDEPVLGVRVVGGRSQCMTCQVGLKWYELVPLFSFLVQGAKCRHCKHSLNWQYPIVEFVTAILTVALPYFLYTFYGASVSAARGEPLLWFYFVSTVWLLIAYVSIVLSAIDLRLRIIPDQCNLLLGLLGALLLGFRYWHEGALSNFTGAYASILGVPENPLVSALIAVAFAIFLFGGTIYFTRGRGMGLGDLKLAIPLAIILGWPDVLIAFMASFIIGSAVGLLMIAGKRATMKAAVPFGPFIVIGMYVAIFYGESILRWYFSLV